MAFRKIGAIMELVDSVVNAKLMATQNHHVIPIGDTANNVNMTKRWWPTRKARKWAQIFPSGAFLFTIQIRRYIFPIGIFRTVHSRQHKHADNLNVLYNILANHYWLMGPSLTNMIYPRECIGIH